MILKLLSFLCLLFFSLNQTKVTWTVNPLIKSGEFKLQLSNVTGPTTINRSPQPFFQTFTQVPTVALGMIDIQATGVSYSLSISTVTTTNFATTLTINVNTTIVLLIYMYLAIQNNQLFSYIYFQSATFSTIQQCYSLQQTVSALDTTHKIIIQPFIGSFSIAASPNYSISTSGSVMDSTTIRLSVCTNSTLTAIQLFILVIDKTALQANFLTFIDNGVFLALNNGTSSTNTFVPPLSGFNYYTSIAGFSQFQAKGNQALSILALQASITTQTSFDSASLAILGWRLRNCPASTYYYQAEQQCYTLCPPATAPQNTFTICLSCALGCTNCTSVNSTTTTCTDCFASSFRAITNGQCLCITNYFDGGFAVCSQCAYTCVSCITTSTTCTQCTATRILANATCNCVVRMYDAGVPTCSPCLYNCLTCSNAANNCTSCNITAHRVLNNNSCFCQGGYQDTNSAQLCTVAPFICATECFTCSVSSTNCTSCSNYRTLNLNKCNCIVGFALTNGNCEEVCGDGIRTNHACDDGNSRNGDGCSSACSVESGFTCNNDNKDKSSVCISNSGYTLTVTSVVKNTFDNFFTATIDITPPPPSSVVPSSTNATLFVQSFSLDNAITSTHQTMVVNINFTNNHLSTNIVNLQLNPINSNCNVPLKMSNSRPIIPYNNQDRTIYFIEIVLMYIYVGLLWIGAIFVWIFIDWKLISAILQLYVYTAMVYVGFLGMPSVGIYFDPLSNLQYCFGYNLYLGNSVFGVLNTGLFLNLLPIIIYFILIALSKRKQNFVSLDIKRMFLFDGFYFWFLMNAFLIVYGLSFSITKQIFNTFSILGLVFGILYLLSYILLSIFLFRDRLSTKLTYLKTNTFNPKLISIYYSALLLSSLIYVCISDSLNVIVLLATTVLLMILVLFSNLLINKARNLLNLISLLLIYGCILLYNKTAAQWSGIVVIGLLFFQLGINFIFMLIERSKSISIDSALQNKQIEDLIENEFRIYNSRDKGEQSQQNPLIIKQQIYSRQNQDLDTPHRIIANQHQEQEYVQRYPKEKTIKKYKKQEQEEDQNYKTALKQFDQKIYDKDYQNDKNQEKNQDQIITPIRTKQRIVQGTENINNPSRINRKILQTQNKHQPLLNQSIEK